MATYTSALNLKKPAGGENVLIGDINGNMDAIDVEAIRSRANFAGTYDASSSYSVGDYCIYGGNLFRCTTAIGSGGETWTAGHWTQVAVGEELTTLNGKIANMFDFGEYPISVTVSANDKAEVNITSTIARTGYTPKIIVPYCISSAVLTNIEESGGNVYVLCRNFSSSGFTTTVNVHVLYKKD